MFSSLSKWGLRESAGIPTSLVSCVSTRGGGGGLPVFLSLFFGGGGMLTVVVGHVET